MRIREESGRSMVEILGVLAIMGVLTVVATWGYTYGMSKFRSNNLLDETRRRALEVAIRLNNDPDMELDNEPYGDIADLGYEVETLNKPENRSFEITYQGVPHAVCLRTMDMKWNEPIEILANDRSQNSFEPCGDEEEVAMTFVFAHNYGESTECECSNNNECINKYGGTKRTYCDRATCLCIEEPRNNMKDRDGNTHPCSEKAPINVLGVEENCNDCPNRKLFKGSGQYYNYDMQYSYCVLPCPSDKPLQDKNGSCYACDDNKNIQTPNKAMCEVCATKPGPFGTPRSYRGYRNFCDYGCTDGYFMGYSGCVSCTTPSSVSVSWYETGGGTQYLDNSKRCTTVCNGSSEDRPKRVHEHVGSSNLICYLETCPSDKPLRDKNGGCHPCSENQVDQGVKQQFLNTCSICKDAEGNRTHILQGSICKKGNCAAGMVLKDDGSCGCPEGTFVVGNECRDCDDPRNPGNQTVNQTECSVCGSKRTWVGLFSGSACLKTKNDDEFYSASGTYPCNSEGTFWTYESYCSACSGQRVSVGGGSNIWCSLPCPEGEFMDINGHCYPCDYSSTVVVKGPGRSNIYKGCYEQCPGQRYEVSGSADCKKCSTGTYSAVAGSCTPCPETASELSSKGACVACGHTWYMGACRGCPDNTYNKNGTCTECPEEWEDLPTETYCVACGGAWDEDLKKCIDPKDY